MANAKVCDRCGGFYKDNSRFPKNVGMCRTVIDGVCLSTRTSDTTDYMDLCDDCIEKLKAFLNGRELKEENV